MDSFCKDSLRFGCLKGFKYFSLYLRGREELLVIVENRAQPGVTPRSNKASPKYASYFHPIDNGLPPASPSERDPAEASPEETVFLIGGYARYKCPYVWLRSNHTRLRTSRGPADKDLPLKLSTTEGWKTTNAKVWEIVAELVSLNTQPCPENPFALDIAFIETLPPLERSLVCAGLVSFLRELYLSDASYSDLVYGDLCHIINSHFAEIGSVLRSTTAS
mmetsp:Transcript_31661/g.51100  ORF Transcript_31661/g.51100 Transcript_31661/m.51100 type:complete len:220 (-) Transcript_31661:205-864(-)